MTNERAIELLHRLQDEQFDSIHGDERREALEMAVRALSGEGDTISRKMAIDSMWKIRRQQQMLDDSHKADLVMQGIYLAEKALEQLPSAQPQACDDAISRDDAIMAVKTGALSAATIFGRTDEGATAYYETVKAIKALPSAQPERKNGHWIGIDDYPYESWECDQCGCVYEQIPSWTPNFCPNCGADMRGESDETD